MGSSAIPSLSLSLDKRRAVGEKNRYKEILLDMKVYDRIFINTINKGI
jgi:hypothetical protein